MNRLTHLLVMGYACKANWAEALRKGITGFLKSGILLNWMSCACLVLSLSPAMQLARAPERLQGAWVDESVSQVFTRKLGVSTQVSGVHFLGWTAIGFGRLEIRRPDGSLMVSAESGTIRLKSLSLRKSGFFETELILRGAELMRAYYRNIHPQRFWARWMRRPVGVRHLTARIRQNDQRTSVQILEWRSPDIRLEGQVVFERSGAVQDGLQLSMSPLRFLAAAI